MTNRVILIVGAAAVLLVVVTVAVTVLVVGGDGGGSAGGQSPPVNRQNPEPEESRDVTGEWLLVAPVDTEDPDYEEDDPSEFAVLVKLQRDNEGTLVGVGYSEYTNEIYEDIEVVEPEEIGGATSFAVFDSSEGMKVGFEDETESPGELGGYAEGFLGTGEPDVEGPFTAERR